MTARALIPAVACVIAGCSAVGTPSLNHGVFMHTDPNVGDLVKHINCEIALSMVDRDSDWSRLWDYNFVASIDLTLTVTNTEGFDLSRAGSTLADGIQPAAAGTQRHGHVELL